LTQYVFLVVCGLKPDQPNQEIYDLEEMPQNSQIVNDDMDKKIVDFHETWRGLIKTFQEYETGITVFKTYNDKY